MSAQASTDSAAGSVISLPKGGGAVGGLGETFSPDPFTGTGTFSFPIALPAGRDGLRPGLTLSYSTGSGRGPFGLGWQLSVPGVVRKTSRGVPRYADAPADVFLLSGAEDLVPVAGSYPGRVRYRPRTEGLFARVEHVKDGTDDYWEVSTKDGNRSRYGTPRPGDAPAGWRDPAVVADPDSPGHVFAWRIVETTDPLGNLIRYEYRRDSGDGAGHRWDQPLLSRVSYADYGDRADPSFLVSVEFDYSPRPDPFSEYRAGFEVRTTLRCDTIRVATHAADGVTRVQREYRLGYATADFNGASLLTSVTAVGIDDTVPAGVEALPPLVFTYSRFDPAGRRFTPVTGPGLPASAFNARRLALVDLRGAGLPDLVEFGPAQRYWRNAGHGRFTAPRALNDAPAFLPGEPGVRVMDADGDGRADLVVTRPPAIGYFPLTFAGTWSRRSFRAYRQVPGVNLADPRVRLVDLTGDGLTDVLHSGSRLRAWFNDPDPGRAWSRTAAADGPPVDLADPRVRLADLTGDGLADLVLLGDGHIVYWPNLGHGRWGAKVSMRDAPRLPDGHDPRRLLLGDVDGDGLADLVYVDDGRVLVWGNRSGNGWTPTPVTLRGTVSIVDTDALDLTDLTGTGVSGLLYSSGRDGTARFLDLTGGVKPYLLTGMDNRLGATTTVTYQPSTVEYLRDEADPATRWRTTLPMPVPVVTRVEVSDAISGGRLTSEYRYHHGYWDGVEREFRGFAMVEHADTETIGGEHFSPPTLLRTWFHVGPVAAVEAGDWTELDLRHEYWSGDQPMLARPGEVSAFLAGLPRPARRVALRALRGQVLRTELYARDGSARQDRPYTVTESVSGVRAEAPGVYFPFAVASRTTEWERGDEPMTRFELTDFHDAYGFATARLSVAVPRGRDPRVDDAAAAGPYLATLVTTGFARRDDAGRYLVDRVARTTVLEVVNDGRTSVAALRDAVLESPLDGVSTRVIGHTRTHYDGEEFVGLPLGTLGEHGLPVRSETLRFTDAFLDGLYETRPLYLAGEDPQWTDEYPAGFRAGMAPLAGYRHDPDGEVPGFYVAVERHRYDVHVPGRVPRGLPIESIDPLGASSRLEYDVHDLLPERSIDPVGLVTSAAYDLRTLRPHTVTDVNGNTESVAFSPSGLVTARYRRGKDGEGDRDAPGTRISYDLTAFAERGRPLSVRTERRVHHDGDAGATDDVIVSVLFVDGFGRAVQTRSRAEAVLFGDAVHGRDVLPADQLADSTAPVVPRESPSSTVDNVVVSGWQVHDNKGRPVRQHEPFFATGYEYAEPGPAELGHSVTLFYDPPGHVVRTLHPDGAELRVVFGVPADPTDPDTYAPTPWESHAYDANDNAGRTHPDSAGGYRDHWNTPSGTELDALGRVVRGVTTVDGGQRLVTRARYDIQGNLVSTVDPLGREAFRFTVDLGGRRWRVEGLDVGRRDTVPDATDAPLENRDARGALTLATYDPLRRVSAAWARDGADGAVTLRQRFEYGDGGTPDQPPGERAAARAANLLSRPVRHYDEAGLVTLAAADFKGNIVESVRRVIADAPILATYAAAEADGWRVAPLRVDWTPAAGQSPAQRAEELLDPRGYVTTNSYDALDRVTRRRLPSDVEGHRPELVPGYNPAGELDQVSLDGTVHVRQISYDAKGQRTLIAYGNGVLTRCAYDPRTTRLVRLRTEHYTPAGAGYQPGGEILQDHGYAYDLTGNLLGITDLTPGSGVPGNPDALAIDDPVLRDLVGRGQALRRRFTYDPGYRLLTATGREHEAPPPGDPWPATPRGTDATRAQSYVESYTHDALGNLLTLRHAGPGGFTRTYTVPGDRNSVTAMTVGDTGYDYAYDANGNLVAETTSRHFDWDHADRMVAFATRAPGAEPSVHAHYLYAATGERVTKLVRRQGGAIEVTHYLDGIMEHHRWPGGENTLVHVMDDQRRIAIVRRGPAHPDDGGPATAYHLADHLGSSAVVVDGDGTLTNREEFTPYGETSFGAYTRKRYRFTGRERDEESGLAYHHARYRLSWLGRWASVDPLAARSPERSPYEYADSNPLVLTDDSGRQPDLNKEQRRFVDRVENNAAESEQFARDNPDGPEKLREDLRQVESRQKMYPSRDPNSPDAREARRLKTQLNRYGKLQTDHLRLAERVDRVFPAGKGMTGVRDFPWTQKVRERLAQARSVLRGETPPPPGPRGGGNGGGRGGGGGGGGGGNGAGPVERAPSGRGARPFSLRESIAPMARGAARVGSVLGALGLLDAAHSVTDDLKAHRYGSAAATTAEAGLVMAGLRNPITVAPTAAYVVARTYHANREAINDHAAAFGEFFDPIYQLTGHHSIMGAPYAAGWAVAESTGRAVAGAGVSIWHGATWAGGLAADAAKAVWDWL